MEAMTCKNCQQEMFWAGKGRKPSYCPRPECKADRHRSPIFCLACNGVIASVPARGRPVKYCKKWACQEAMADARDDSFAWHGELPPLRSEDKQDLMSFTRSGDSTWNYM